VSGRPNDCIGLAALARMVFEGADIQPLWAQLVEKTAADPNQVGALMDMSMLLQLTGDRDNGLALQAQVLDQSRLFHRPASGPGALRLLALMAPGDMMANTPLDFLLEGGDIELSTLYVTADAALPDPLPEHDVAFMALGESEANHATLLALESRLRRWPKPLLNRDARRISELTRDGVCALLAGAPGIVAPATVRVDRARLAKLAQGEIGLEPLLGEGAAFPVIVRPIGSHAGAGLEKLDTPQAVAAYLAGQACENFYLAPFIDYSRADDGLFRKQRIALFDGRAHISHMAVSAHWMVHYMNAAMLESPKNRAEEAHFMETFEDAFCARQAIALQALIDRIGLDYFAIDCAETRDGELLLFEADVAMIIHDMDPPDLFPYKGPQMRKLFGAFQGMVREAALSPSPAGPETAL
jgi:hypothetical protein